MAEDVYLVLGVATDADVSEIKKAFRAIARECHPDVAGDDPVKGDRFKKAREAYETLVEPEARAKYDRRKQRVVRQGGSHGTFFDAMWKRTGNAPAADSGPAPAKQARPRPAPTGARADAGNRVDLDDLFAAGFGTRAREAGRSRKPAASVRPGMSEATIHFRNGASAPLPADGGPKRGDDLAIELDVPDSVVARGGTVSTKYRRFHRNPRWIPGGAEAEVVEVEDLVDVRVIRGTADGDVLIERGKGNAGTNYGPYGDLRVTVRRTRPAPTPAVGSTPVAVPSGVVEVTVAEAILGGRVDVETPTGRVRVAIAPGTSSGTRLRLAGKGEGGADWYVETRIVVPAAVDEESRALIEEFARRNAVVPSKGD
jgi:DnaJ-class molecular chaperone